MSDNTNPVVARLTELGVGTDFIEKIVTDLGASDVDQLHALLESDLTGIGMKPLPARALLKKLLPAVSVVTPQAQPVETNTDPSAVLPDGKSPSVTQVHSFAGSIGMDPNMLTMLMLNSGGGGGVDLNISDMVPIATVVEGYNPKCRNMFMMLMTKLEERFGVPIVVVDADGSVNKALTTEYIQSLDEGRDPAEDDIYYGTDQIPREVVGVGVDKQSVYDADPLDPENKVLTKSGQGTGRINWYNVPLEVRQVVYFAIKSGEINPANEAHLTWLRDHINQAATRMIFHSQAPKALAAYNEAARSGSLPTLRKSVSGRPARRTEIMARRRRAEARDMSDARRAGDGNSFPTPYERNSR